MTDVNWGENNCSEDLLSNFWFLQKIGINFYKSWVQPCPSIVCGRSSVSQGFIPMLKDRNTTPCLLSRTLLSTSLWSLSEVVVLYLVHKMSCMRIRVFWKQSHNVSSFVSWCWMNCFLGRILFQLHSHWQLWSQDFSASHLSVNLQQCVLLKVKKDIFLAKYL